jgi:hypothetical protein
MKKIVASVGLVALASSINSALSQDMSSAPPPKPWNVSATLRGFYDDNINTLPQKTNSFGFQISPGVTYGIQNDQTIFNLGYVYTFRYYQNRPLYNANNYDQDNAFNGEFDHVFTERYRLSIKDSFVVGQEPDLLRASATMSEFQRVSGNNIRNYGGFVFNAEVTRLLGLEAGYGNQYYNYANSGAQNYGFPPYFPPLGVGQIINGVFTPGATQAGLLNRIVQSPYLNTRWQIEPQTVGIVGYMYQGTMYTADEPIGNVNNNPFAPPIMSDSRNSRSQYGYIGVDHNFLPDFSTEIVGGARYTDFYNENTTEWDPYVRASLQYNYAEKSFAKAGISYDNTATDVVGIGNNGVTLGANAFVIFADLTHQLVPNLFGNLNFQFQNNTFVGGLYDNQREQYYLVGVNVTYQINPHCSADVGYNYDQLVSDVPNTSFNRNRVYIGITGMY